MKKFVFAGAIALLVGGQALAADLPPPPGPAPKAPSMYLPPSPVYNWTGVYIGINGGYGFGNSTWQYLYRGNVPGVLIPPASSVAARSAAIINSVRSLSASRLMATMMDISGSTSSAGCFAIATGTNCQTSSTWLATVRGRAGWAWDRILFYGTGGGAFGNVQGASRRLHRHQQRIRLDRRRRC